jgi:regulator of sigma E protease
MIALIAFVLILSLLIFVHELGHFVVAKRSGIIVEEFGFGYPPRAWKFWQDEGRIRLNGQDYRISRQAKVPRNLYVGAQVTTEIGPGPDGELEVSQLTLVSHREEDRQTQRPATAGKPDVSAEPQTPADGDQSVHLVEALERPTEYTVNWIPFGGFVRMLGEENPNASGSFASKSKRIRLAVLVAGAGMNLLLAAVVFSMTYLAGVPEPIIEVSPSGEELPVVDVIVDEVMPGSPAADAGLQAGDVIVAVDDRTLRFPGDLVDYIDETKGSQVTLRVRREGRLVTVNLVPRANPPQGEGPIGIGLHHELQREIVYYPMGQAMIRGAAETVRIVAFTFYVPIAIIQDIIPAEAARPTGPVGIYQLTGQAVSASVDLQWWYPVLWITAMLSTALAVTNLLPLPALDGGRIFFILVEAVRGKRIDPEKEGAIHIIGLAVLVTLMVVISYYDVIDPIQIPDFADLF